MAKQFYRRHTSNSPKEFLRLLANVEILSKDKFGKQIDIKRYHNIVVAVGRQAIVQMLANPIANPIKEFAWGDGAHNISNPTEFTEANISDTELFNEVYRKDVDSYSFPTSTSVRFVGILGVTDLVGQNISEQGLFLTDGTMFAHLCYPLIVKGPVQIEFRWSFTL